MPTEIRRLYPNKDIIRFFFLKSVTELDPLFHPCPLSATPSFPTYQFSKCVLEHPVEVQVLPLEARVVKSGTK